MCLTPNTTRYDVRLASNESVFDKHGDQFRYDIYKFDDYPMAEYAFLGNQISDGMQFNFTTKYLNKADLWPVDDIVFYGLNRLYNLDPQVVMPKYKENNQGVIGLAPPAPNQ